MVIFKKSKRKVFSSTFNVPRFKWPVPLSGPDSNARMRAAGACFY
jgi:hypothetical protein